MKLTIRRSSQEDDRLEYNIVKIVGENYSLYNDMISRKINGNEKSPSNEDVPQSILIELQNPNLFIYAVEVENKYIGAHQKMLRLYTTSIVVLFYYIPPLTRPFQSLCKHKKLI